MTTGQRIKTARKKAGMTQADLAKKLGISYVGISQWENDLRNPKFETLQRIAKALDVSIYELFDGSTVDEDGALHIWPAQTEVVEHEGPLQKAEDTLVKQVLGLDLGAAETHTRLIHSLGVTNLVSDILKQISDPKARISTALDKLNEEGQQKAAERVEELTEIPRYQAQEPPQEPPSAPGDTDTAPAPDSPQRPPEGQE